MNTPVFLEYPYLTHKTCIIHRKIEHLFRDTPVNLFPLLTLPIHPFCPIHFHLHPDPQTPSGSPTNRPSSIRISWRVLWWSKTKNLTRIDF